MYLSVIAYVQAIVSSPLDIRRSLKKNIDRVIPLEFVNDTPLAKRKTHARRIVLDSLTIVFAVLE